MTKEVDQFIGYLKFFGPSVEEGRIDIEKIGNSLVALNKLFKKYSKKEEAINVSLKLGNIKKKCTVVNIVLEQIVPIAKPVVGAMTVLLIAKSIGIDELGKQFFGTIGQQIALKLFSKGQKLEKQKDLFENDKNYVLVKNIEGHVEKFLKEIYDSQKDSSSALNDLIQLEEQREEKIEVGYYVGSSSRKVADVDWSQKDYFQIPEELSFEERLLEEFDESKSEHIKIIGRFVDYYGLARKYHFSFQARKNQDEIGKQKTICIVDDSKVSEIIDLLKPEW